jgi:hypothetical protein
MRAVRKALYFCALLTPALALGGEPDPVRVLDGKMYYLGTPGLTEWDEFEGKTPHGRRLDVTFQAEENPAACTLFVRQDDVKFPWSVQLNGKKFGELMPMDGWQVTPIGIPAKALRKGENTLAFVSPLATDDILLGDIRLDSRPLEKALGDAKIQIRVTDKNSKGLPCRITLADDKGALMPLVVLNAEANQPSKLLAARPGVVYTRDGVAELGVLPGSYTVYATRGFEYSMATQTISVAKGESKSLELQIVREVPTRNLIACDTHIHTRTFSGHGDATVDERMLTIAGEGIELAVSTEHNLHADYREAQTRTAMLDHFTPVPGNEITTKVGHFNAFPIKAGSAPPDAKVEDWPVLLQSIRGTPGVQVVTLNHPRDLHTNFTPFGPQNLNPVSGEHFRASDLKFDAVEVVTSAAMQSDIELQYRDWFALLNYGYRFSGIASSDSHDVSRFILGQGRTYVVCDDSKPGQINIDEACKNFREGRVAASLGLLPDLRVEDHFAPGDLATGLGEKIRVTATVLGPSWVNADRIELFANGTRIQDQHIEPTTAIEKAKITWTIPRPAQDTYLVVIATGPGVTAPCWAIPKPYQPSSKAWVSRVMGSTNPIWLDADGDGKWTSPRAFAAKLLAQSDNNLAKLLALLATHDRAVCTQAASLCDAAKMDLRGDAAQALWKAAHETVRAAFAEYLAGVEQCEAAKKPAPQK